MARPLARPSRSPTICSMSKAIRRWSASRPARTRRPARRPSWVCSGPKARGRACARWLPRPKRRWHRLARLPPFSMPAHGSLRNARRRCDALAGPLPARLQRSPKRRTLSAKCGDVLSPGRANRLDPKERSREGTMRLRPNHIHALLLTALLAAAASTAYDQAMAPTNSLPNPYRSVENWAKLPDGRIWGSTSGVDVDPDGQSMWVIERCSAQGFIPLSQMKEGVPFNCDGSKLAPILKFDASGKLVKSFGEELLVFPHGLHVDRDGNVWVTDGIHRGPKGQQVIKFSPD